MQTIQLNLTPCGVPPTIYASMYDIGRIFEFEIYEDAASLSIPTNATVVIRGMKPDHHAFVYSTKDDTPNVSFSGNVVTVTSTEQMTAEPGRTVCELVIEHENTILATLNFFLDVEQAAMPDDADTSASDLMMYQDMVNRTAASEKAAANSASAADATYKKTSDVYNQAVKDIAEQRTQINKDIDDKKSEIQELIDNFNKGSLYTEDITLLASGWAGSDPPYSYTLSQATDTNAIFIDMAMPGLTEDQIGAISAANLSGSKGNIIYATGEKPEIDIPVRLVYLKGDNK